MDVKALAVHPKLRHVTILEDVIIIVVIFVILLTWILDYCGAPFSLRPIPPPALNPPFASASASSDRTNPYKARHLHWGLLLTAHYQVEHALVLNDEARVGAATAPVIDHIEHGCDNALGGSPLHANLAPVLDAAGPQLDLLHLCTCAKQQKAEMERQREAERGRERER